jgi:hypothetical protein
MPIGKEEVMEVLSDFRIQSIRFHAGSVPVNVEEYDRVADFIGTEAIKIKLTKEGKHYLPQRNTLVLVDGDSRNDFNVRSGVLHECTHVISDINKLRITRLHDEAAAYLAQFAFLKLLDPSFEAPPLRRVPINDLIRLCLSLVEKYGLGQPKGFGANISASDIDDVGFAVQRNPEYSNIGDTEQLAADGVDLTEEQAMAHVAAELARRNDKAKYEAWLISTLNEAKAGGKQKSIAYNRLRHHFFVIYKPTATILLHRLSAIKTGDRVSELFHSAFTPQEQHDLLETLRYPKPPG